MLLEVNPSLLCCDTSHIMHLLASAVSLILLESLHSVTKCQLTIHLTVWSYPTLCSVSLYNGPAPQVRLQHKSCLFSYNLLNMTKLCKLVTSVVLPADCSSLYTRHIQHVAAASPTQQQAYCLWRQD